MNDHTQERQKALAREAIARQEWRVYISLEVGPLHVSETLIDKLMAVLESKGRPPDMMDAMQVAATQRVLDYHGLRQSDAWQQELLFRQPGLHAAHYLGLDGELYASDVEFYPYE